MLLKYCMLTIIMKTYSILHGCGFTAVHLDCIQHLSHTCTAALKFSRHHPEQLYIWMQMSESVTADTKQTVPNHPAPENVVCVMSDRSPYVIHSRLFSTEFTVRVGVWVMFLSCSWCGPAKASLFWLSLNVRLWAVANGEWRLPVISQKVKALLYLMRSLKMLDYFFFCCCVYVCHVLPPAPPFA